MGLNLSHTINDFEFLQLLYSCKINRSVTVTGATVTIEDNKVFINLEDLADTDMSLESQVTTTFAR